VKKEVEQKQLVNQTKPTILW